MRFPVGLFFGWPRLVEGRSVKKVVWMEGIWLRDGMSWGHKKKHMR